MNRGTRTFARTIAALLLTFCGTSSVIAQAAKHAKLSLVSERVSLIPGDSQWIGLRFELEPGWHIYWTNPGDSGEPPKITWHLPSGIQATELQFPAPQRIADHGLTDYGYQGHVLLLSKLTVPAGIASKKADIAADVRYLVCREVCVPAKQHLAVAVPLDGKGKESAEAGIIQTAAADLPKPLPSGVHVSATSKVDNFVVAVASKRSDFGDVSDFIPFDAQVVENSAKPIIEHGKDMATMTLKKSEQLSQPVAALRGLLIANDKAYEISIPVTGSTKPGAKGSSKKTVPQKISSSNEQ